MSAGAEAAAGAGTRSVEAAAGLMADRRDHRRRRCDVDAWGDEGIDAAASAAEAAEVAITAAAGRVGADEVAGDGAGESVGDGSDSAGGMPPARAAPSATTCLGWVSRAIGQRKAAASISLTNGMRDDPPTRTSVNDVEPARSADARALLVAAIVPLQRLTDQVLEFGAGQADRRRRPSDGDRHHGFHVEGQSFLCFNAVCPEPTETDQFRIPLVQVRRNVLRDVTYYCRVKIDPTDSFVSVRATKDLEAVDALDDDASIEGATSEVVHADPIPSRHSVVLAYCHAAATGSAQVMGLSMPARVAASRRTLILYSRQFAGWVKTTLAGASPMRSMVWSRIELSSRARSSTGGYGRPSTMNGTSSPIRRLNSRITRVGSVGANRSADSPTSISPSGRMKITDGICKARLPRPTMAGIPLMSSVAAAE